MAFTKTETLTITSGSPSGNTIYEAIDKIDDNIDGIITDLNTLDERAPAYGTIWVPAKIMTPLSTGACAALAQIEYTTNDDVLLDYFAFDKDAEEYAGFTLVMPENWDRSTIKAKFYWAPGHASAVEGTTVEWQIQGIALSNDDNMDTTEFTDTGEVISDGVTAGKNLDLHITSATPAVTINGTPALGDLIYLKVSRNVGGTDDMGYDAWLFGVLIQYTIDNTVAAW